MGLRVSRYKPRRVPSKKDKKEPPKPDQVYTPIGRESTKNPGPTIDYLRAAAAYANPRSPTPRPRGPGAELPKAEARKGGWARRALNLLLLLLLLLVW